MRCPACYPQERPMPIETQCYEKKLVRRDDTQANPKSEVRNLAPLTRTLAISDFELRISDLPANRYVTIKSVLEFVAATFLLALTLPLILLAVALVKLTSRGPGIYSQMRLGLFGK